MRAGERGITCKQGAQEPKDAELSKRTRHAAGCRPDTGDQAFANWVLWLGAKKAVLTIGSSFKHSRPQKDPLHGRIRLLQVRPGEGAQGSASSCAEARGPGTEGRDRLLPPPRCGQLGWSAVPRGSQGFCGTRTPATCPAHTQTRGDLSPHAPGPG